MRGQITAYAKSLGFDLVGFTPAKIAPKYKKAFQQWLKNQHHADMVYMEKIKERVDLQKIFKGAKTVIALGTNYYYDQPPLKHAHGRIARYAYGRDYHKVIGKRLKELEKFIAEICEGNDHTDSSPDDVSIQTQTPILTKSYVDTGPLMERALAEQAGIGRIGKNGCVISKEFGSWIFLSEIITTLDLATPLESFPGERLTDPGRPGSQLPSDRWSNPQEKSFNVCGNCTRCMTACPTGAIIAPGVIDSKLCISYLTIESKEKIPPHLAKIIKKTRRIFGCDICQEVCPHNIARQKPTKVYSHADWPKIAGDQQDLAKVQSIKTRKEYTKTFAGSPLMRWKLPGHNRQVFRSN